MITDWVGLIFIAAIAVCGAIAASNRPAYRVDVCLVGSGPNGEDMTTNVWSDQVKRYMERYPGSYCGKCGTERPCPEGD